jgi:hypothetical protein
VDVEPGGDLEANKNRVTIIITNEDSSGDNLTNWNSPPDQVVNRNDSVANRSVDNSASIGLFDALAALQDAIPSTTASSIVAATSTTTAGDVAEAGVETTEPSAALNQTNSQEITRSTWELTQG